MRLALPFAALALIAGCGKNTLYAQIDGAVIPECDDSVPAAAGPTMVLYPESHEELYKLPAGPVVRIAADRGVSWRRVRQVAQRLEQRGAQVVLLCGRGTTTEVAAFQPIEALQPGTHMKVDASRGEFFVHHPGSETVTHVRSFDQQHIAKSFVREVMGPVVAASKVHDVEVSVDPHMNWADMIRAVDGARTCCPGVEMRATLVEPATPAAARTGPLLR